MDTFVKPPRVTAARTVALAAAAAALAVAGVAEAGPTAVVLTGDNRLARFDTDTPGTSEGSVAVSGLDADESLLGIDFRPAAPDQLFGLSSFGQLYRINAVSGSATKVGPALDAGTVPLGGGSYGVDFNPTVDRIRVVSDVGENLRLNPDTGEATVDAVLAFAAADDDDNAGEPAGVTAVAYSNSDTDAATATTLYGIDSSFGVLVTVDPPNEGTLNTVGSTGQDDLPHFTGFDILGADQAFAVTTAEDAFGSLPALSSRLFSIDLGTGLASELGVLGDGSLDVHGFALTSADLGGGGGGPTPIPLPPAAFAFPLLAAFAGYFHRRTRSRMAAN